MGAAGNSISFFSPVALIPVTPYSYETRGRAVSYSQTQRAGQTASAGRARPRYLCGFVSSREPAGSSEPAPRRRVGRRARPLALDPAGDVALPAAGHRQRAGADRLVMAEPAAM